MRRAFDKVLDFCINKKAYLISMLLPAAILFVAYAIFGMYPFGERAVLGLDLNAQYVYYFDYMYDVFAGKESIFYCWSGSLSGEFAGLFAYYLASPFNFIVWIFPRENICEGIMAMQLVKSAAVGFCCALMLKKRRGFSDCTVILFSVMYALSGYFTAHTVNPMWLDGLIALPLVLYGTELICDKRKFQLYVVSLVYVFVSNFYIGYMVGIFSALYFVYYLASGRSSVKSFPEGVKAVAAYGFGSVSGILMSCWMVLPVYKSLSNGKFGFGDPDYTPVENFNIGDIFLKLFPATFDTIRPEGLPMIYCGTLGLIFAAVYFITRKISARQRIAGGFLLGILVLSMYIKPVDMFWHGGQVPVWMPFRYAFIISFLMIMFGAEAFENIRSVRARSIGSVFLVLTGVLLFSDYYGGNDRFNTNLIIVVPLIALAVTAAAAAAYKRYFKFKGIGIVMAILVTADLLVNAVVTFDRMHDDIYYSTRESYVTEIPPTRDITGLIHRIDSGFYRMEKTYHRTVNDPMALRMYGMSHSTSTFNAKIIKLLKQLGYGAREHYSRYDGATMLTDDIFGVKYILSKYAVYVPYTDTVPAENSIGVTVYENKDAFGMAYLADKGIIGSEIDEFSPFRFQERLASYISGSEEQIYYPIYEVMFDSENITVGATTDGHNSYKKLRDNDKASITYNITMPRKGKAYVYFPTKYERECHLYVNGIYIKNYFESENHSIAYLGDYDGQDRFEVQLRLQKDAVYFEGAQFYYLDEEKLAAFDENVLSRNSETVVTRTGGSSLKIEVNAAEQCALFTSIPFEEGWEAYIDGAPAELCSSVNESLLALEIPQGKHTVELRFFPAGLKTGLIFTAGGIILFAVLMLINPKKSVKPAGDVEESFSDGDDHADTEDGETPAEEAYDDQTVQKGEL